MEVREPPGAAPCLMGSCKCISIHPFPFGHTRMINENGSLVMISMLTCFSFIFWDRPEAQVYRIPSLASNVIRSCTLCPVRRSKHMGPLLFLVSIIKWSSPRGKYDLEKVKLCRALFPIMPNTGKAHSVSPPDACFPSWMVLEDTYFIWCTQVAVALKRLGPLLSVGFESL